MITKRHGRVRVASLLGAMAAAASCSVPRTQLLVGVDTDLPWGVGARVQSVSLEIRRGGASGALRDQRVTALGAGNGRLPLPLWVTVLSTDDGDTSPLWIEALGCARADGCTRETAVAVQRASVRFAVGETQVLRVLLAGACASSGCALTERCAVATGRCVAIDDQADVQPFAGTLPGRWADAGSPDAAVFDAPPVDAPAVDAGPSADGAPADDGASGTDLGRSDASRDAGDAADAGTDAAMLSDVADAADAPSATDTGARVDAATICPPEMVFVAGGTFTMGDDGSAPVGAQPAHRVTLSPYCLDATEVTVDAWSLCPAPSCSTAYTGTYCNVGVTDRSTHPINCVTWRQARSYCQWRGKDLPTEAQWEFAARGADGNPYPWGSTSPGAQLCWNRYPSPGSTCRVGTFARTGAGFADLAGNAAEWTLDCFGMYPSLPGTDPIALESPGCDRVYRGGSWDVSAAADVLSASRNHNTEAYQLYSVGFRCARAPTL